MKFQLLVKLLGLLNGRNCAGLYQNFQKAQLFWRRGFRLDLVFAWACWNA